MTFRMKVASSILVALIVFVTPGRASLIIDNFVISQSVAVTTNNGATSSTLTPAGLFFDTVSATSVVTADREILARLTTAATQSRNVTLSSNSDTAGFLVLNSNPDTGSVTGSGAGEVVYERQNAGDTVISAFAADPNIFALALNFTLYGNQLELRGNVNTEVATSVPVVVTIYGDGVNSGLTATAQFNLTSTLTTYQIPYSSFTGNLSVLSDVGAVRMLVGSGTTLSGTGADVFIDYLSITGTPITPIPEPGTMALLGAGIIGLVAVARKSAA
jgi:hypothetical protein